MKKIKNILLLQNINRCLKHLLQIPIKNPIFILKKELLNIPLFGWYLRKIGSIEIIRETTTKENLNFFEKIKNKVFKEKRPLLIFPQGTRVKFGEKIPFKKRGRKNLYEKFEYTLYTSFVKHW